MVHTNVVAASAATATASADANLSEPVHHQPRPRRLPSAGSFHAGAPFPDLAPYDEATPSSTSRQRRRSSATGGVSFKPLRRQSTHKYHTFPTQPPKTPSGQPQTKPGFDTPALQHQPASDESYGSSDSTSSSAGAVARRRRISSSSAGANNPSTPLPWKQLSLLALLSLAEQTALNSIGPYLPTMVASFDEIPAGQEGLYVGLLASAFALAQLATNLFWGYLSDRVGRKPVMLLGTALLAVCFGFFGFCTSYAQLIAVHVAMGLLNGNAAVVPTCLGEVTDRTNQSRAFTWLPVMYSLGSISGPALGGLLVGSGSKDHPFLAPNVVSAVLLVVSVVVLGVWFDETLDGADKAAAGAGLGWVEKICRPCGSCLGARKTTGRPGGWSSRWPTRGQSGASGVEEEDDDLASEIGDGQAGGESEALLGSGSSAAGDGKKLTSEQKSAFRQLANRTTLAVLGTYLVFQLTNISFNSLYPIFASAPPPTGRELGPGTIGISLSLAGLATILFQVFLFQSLKTRMGNLGTYRFSLLGMAVSMALMPWIGYLDEQKPWLGLGTGKAWLYGELGVILVVKNICAVGGLSSVMLLITNSAPSHETLGTLNGIAQTLSAAGRSVGPFLSGGLFTLSTHVKPKGEVLAWGLFSGIALFGWLGTLLIRSRGSGLESADWQGNDDEETTTSDEEEDVGGVREGR
ncbi:major facilitator superfamily domain-containing protein [Podospora appendiculata]|uniref:Major facilitator superfamily domain-containing protein n=1 Tax=Podospora appendiculata TaxID=314037 RepID=A0AAE0XLS3_9PEZI|nr:major facilitator superfamily domain-containing protein [Podospora appendiculata]